LTYSTEGVFLEKELVADKKGSIYIWRNHMEPLRNVSKQFEICPISSDTNLLIVCPCPTCGEYYKLGYFCVVRTVQDEKDELSEGEDDGEEQYVVGPESLMCFECGQSNLQNILFFLTLEEAKKYLDETELQKLSEVSEYDVDVYFIEAQSYIDSLRDVMHISN
jgi:hypothetical protein